MNLYQYFYINRLHTIYVLRSAVCKKNIEWIKDVIALRYVMLIVKIHSLILLRYCYIIKMKQVSI